MTKDIKEFGAKELGNILEHDIGFPKYHARQIFSWIYQKKAQGFSAMTDLPLALRRALGEGFYILGAKLRNLRKSSDGTVKLLIELADGNLVEAVSIPARGRITGCISSQAGCKYSCAFCASGVLGFKRSLSVSEMLDQMLYLNNSGRIGNVVLMGTGEPFDNYDNVLKFIRTIHSKDTFGIGSRHITISSCGIVPGIERLAGEDMQLELSISLHAADERTRSRIMPVNIKYPLSWLIPACRKYADKTNRQVTFEYLLVKDLNSSLQNAQNLVKLLKGFRLAKVNIIPANPVPELGVEPPAQKDAALFAEILKSGGLNFTIRRPRGRDIEAACGQLRLSHAKK